MAEGSFMSAIKNLLESFDFVSILEVFYPDMVLEKRLIQWNGVTWSPGIQGSD
jgi:hypothetical protein